MKTKKRKLKKVKLLGTICTLLILIFLFILGIFFYNMTGVSSKDDYKNFIIKEGTASYLVIDKLEKENIIRSSFIFKIYMKLNGIIDFKAGEYKINTKDNSFKLYNNFKNNDFQINTISITFKEGINIPKMSKLVSEKLGIESDKFIEVVNDKEYLDTLINKYWFLDEVIKNENIYYGLEGYLFPDTYFFEKNANSKVVIETMLNKMDKELIKYKNDIESKKSTIHEILTLASVIELEALDSESRGVVAGIFYNRLNKNMSLGSDVTAYYANKVDMSQRELKVSELNSDSLYNTRNAKLAGKLPIGPISMPSISSIEASINPTNNDYYYFVADKYGKTYFTKSYSEHNKLINRLEKDGKWFNY